jgi:uncharacterized protein
MITISELYTYPIKSLGGIQLKEVQLTDRGFEHDRRWMLVDANNRFLTQREHARMALLQPTIANDCIEVCDKHNPVEKIRIPFVADSTEELAVTIFSDTCRAVSMSNEINQWFCRFLQIPCKLVYMPDDSLRKVDENFAKEPKNITAFSDGYPILMISKESLADLNSRLEETLSVNRFRPNLVIEGGLPYEEDSMEHFIINDLSFYGVKPCARCMITTINQQTTEKGKEPLKTLATYRMKNNKIYFGQNVIAESIGQLKTGDQLTLKKMSENPVFANIYT